MSLDIKAGDLLIYGAESYPILKIANWEMPRMSLMSFRRMATLTVKTKRATSTGSKISPASSAVDHLTGLKSTPIDPLSGEQYMDALKSLGIDKPTQLLQTFISDGSSFVHLFLEKRL